MNLPCEDDIAAAIATLSAVSSVDELTACAAQLTGHLGLERYNILAVRNGLVCGHYHNAPEALAGEVSSLQAVSDDPIAVRARASRIPFDWQCIEGSWRHRGADHGYRSGVGAGSFDPNGTGCIVLVSWAGSDIPSEYGETLLTYTLMAAIQLCGPLRQLAAPIQIECPLTERELECLLFVLAGRSMKEAAHALCIGPRTVEEYLGRARVKLGVSNSYAAATTALRRGWLDLQRASELADLRPAPGTGHVR